MFSNDYYLLLSDAIDKDTNKSIIKMIYKNSLKINYLIWNDDKLKTNR